MKLDILSHNSIFSSCGNGEFSITFKIPCEKIYNDETQIRTLISYNMIIRGWRHYYMHTKKIAFVIYTKGHACASITFD